MANWERGTLEASLRVPQAGEAAFNVWDASAADEDWLSQLIQSSQRRPILLGRIGCDPWRIRICRVRYFYLASHLQTTEKALEDRLSNMAYRAYNAIRNAESHYGEVTWHDPAVSSTLEVEIPSVDIFLGRRFSARAGAGRKRTVVSRLVV